MIKSFQPPRPSIRECYLGGPVKILKSQEGNDKMKMEIVTGTSSRSSKEVNGIATNKEQEEEAYCDTVVPTKWRGKKLSIRAMNNETYMKPIRSTFGKQYKCEWGQDLSTFCAGLGEVLIYQFFFLFIVAMPYIL